MGCVWSVFSAAVGGTAPNIFCCFRHHTYSSSLVKNHLIFLFHTGTKKATVTNLFQWPTREKNLALSNTHVNKRGQGSCAPNFQWQLLIYFKLLLKFTGHF